MRCYLHAVAVYLIGSIDDDFFFSSRRRHTRFKWDWSSDVCPSDLVCRLLLEIENNHATKKSHARIQHASIRLQISESNNNHLTPHETKTDNHQINTHKQHDYNAMD